MNMRRTLLIGLLLAFTILIVAAQEEQAQKGRSDFKLPKLFNFDYYKELFKKRYGSFAEELDRSRLFLAQAYQAFISGVSYKFRLSKYYLSINDFSDRTPAELKDMDAKLILSDDLQEVQADLNPAMQTPPLMSLEKLEQKLNEIKLRADEPGYSIIAKEVENLQDKVARRKRATESTARQDFSMDELIEKGSKKPRPNRAARAKAERSLISNNPYYQPPEVVSGGVTDYLPSLSSVKDSFSMIIGYADTNEHNEIGLADGLSKDAQSQQTLPDEVFVDHRESDCLFDVGNQAKCASCYAFTATSYFEWAICKEAKISVKLSEQHMIDCGKGAISNGEMSGCGGGFITRIGEFYNRFGFELDSHYPYIGYDGTCPYTNETEAGFFRGWNPHRKFIAPKEKWDYYLKNGPMIITIGIQGDFKRYGGGIHDGKDCCKGMKICGGHAMLLIGHGRQDGEEYWLIRNSYGDQWGEEGYYKLNKKADCIHPHYGWMYATQDGLNIRVFPERNHKRPNEADERIRDSTRYKKSWW